MFLILVLLCIFASEGVGECSDCDQYSMFSEEDQTITLRNALSLALLKNPELGAFSYEVRAREALILQAGLLPNPEIEGEIEDFGGDKAHKGFQAAESTLRLSQLIELGGKRKNRKSVARYDKSLSCWDYESKRLDVLYGTSIAFIDVLFAQENVALAREQYLIAQEVYNTVSEKVKAGKVSPVEEAKAKVALSTTRIELERAERDRNSDMLELASFWGSTNVNFEKVIGDLDTVIKIPDLKKLMEIVIHNPDLARWCDEIKFRQSIIALEKSQAIPDVTVGGGIKKFEETKDYGFVVNLSIPIPIFNRNQGNICKAKNKLAKSKKEYDASNIKVRADLFQVYEDLSAAYIEVIVLKEDVLSSAKQAFDASSEGYKQGKFEYLDVLDAQRTFFSTRAQYLTSLSRYHKSFAELERLTGGCLGTHEHLHSKGVKQ
ncbi:MAG: TolC family protein [Chlamydiota bacterium]|nr:TolC family protein [Chlamydiota bacterium]